MIRTEKPANGTLYVVPTPIGNLEDITLRAIRILKEVDLIAAEDTRHSRKLLNHLGISTPLISYYREKEFERSRELLSRLKEGSSIALITDAGTPGISDPGSVIVREAREQSIPVVPLPGASALTTALSAYGLEATSFLFLGFPPAKKGQRIKLFESVAKNEYTLVFYESPHRIEQMLADALEVFGNRQAFWARELTKSHEDLLAGCLTDLLAASNSGRDRGEFVVIIAPGIKEEVKGESIEDMLLWYRDNSDLSLKDVCRQLAEDLGISRSKIYQQALTIWNSKDDNQ